MGEAMELIVIDETKLTIMLTAPDMQHYDLHAERMTTANAATRNAFRHIFNDARQRIGFDTSGERLLVQLYTSRGGGCEIFVTKLCAEDDATDTADASEENELSAEDALLARIAKEEAMPIPPASAISSLPPELPFCLPDRPVLPFPSAGYPPSSSPGYALHTAAEHRIRWRGTTGIDPGQRQRRSS